MQTLFHFLRSKNLTRLCEEPDVLGGDVAVLDGPHVSLDEVSVRGSLRGGLRYVPRRNHWSIYRSQTETTKRLKEAVLCGQWEPSLFTFSMALRVLLADRGDMLYTSLARELEHVPPICNTGMTHLS